MHFITADLLFIFFAGWQSFLICFIAVQKETRKRAKKLARFLVMDTE